MEKGWKTSKGYYKLGGIDDDFHDSWDSKTEKFLNRTCTKMGTSTQNLTTTDFGTGVLSCLGEVLLHVEVSAKVSRAKNYLERRQSTAASRKCLVADMLKQISVW